MPIRNGLFVDWKRTIKLKDLLTDDETDAGVQAAAIEVHSRLEDWRKEHYPDDFDLEEISDEFHSVWYCDDDPGDRLAWFNSVLWNFYDWADDNLVWVE